MKESLAEHLRRKIVAHYISGYCVVMEVFVISSSWKKMTRPYEFPALSRPANVILKLIKNILRPSSHSVDEYCENFGLKPLEGQLAAADPCFQLISTAKHGPKP